MSKLHPCQLRAPADVPRPVFRQGSQLQYKYDTPQGAVAGFERKYSRNSEIKNHIFQKNKFENSSHINEKKDDGNRDRENQMFIE